MKSDTNCFPIAISISEQNDKIIITVHDLSKQTTQLASPQYFYEISTLLIELPKNLKKCINFKKLKYYVDKASLNLTNPLHLSWLCLIFIQTIQKESKLVIESIKLNVNNPVYGYYLLKNYSLNQIESELKVYSQNKLISKIDIELSIPINYDKKELLNRALLSEIKQFLGEVNNRNYLRGENNKSSFNFSLVIPTLAKNLSFLDECLKSVYDSSLKPNEIILIVPDKANFTEKFSDSNRRSLPLRILEGNNCGIGQARLVGSKAAKSEYVAFVDDDDIVDPDFFQELSKALKSNSRIAAVGCWLESFGFANHILPQFDNLPLIGLLNCSPSAGILMWRKKDLFSLGGHDPEFKSGYEDFDLTVRALVAGKTIRVVDSPLYLYRRHMASTTMNYTERLEQKYRALIMAKTLKSQPNYSQPIANMLFINGAGIKQENPFYWESTREFPKVSKRKNLLRIYHLFPYYMRIRIHRFLTEL
jgi:GT2 family glycosyltransferase